MRLAIAQYQFLPDGDGLKVCALGKPKTLARLLPDTALLQFPVRRYAGIWRVVRADGSLSDLLNKARAKDIAFGLAETAEYLRPHRRPDPAENGDFSEAPPSPVAKKRVRA